MMNEEQNRLLADIRELTLELESSRLSLRDQDYLKLCADILKQLRADGAPMYPVVEFMKNTYGVERDNDGQGVIYLGDMPEDDLEDRHIFKGSSIMNDCEICGHGYAHPGHAL